MVLDFIIAVESSSCTFCSSLSVSQENISGSEVRRGFHALIYWRVVHVAIVAKYGVKGNFDFAVTVGEFMYGETPS